MQYIHLEQQDSLIIIRFQHPTKKQHIVINAAFVEELVTVIEAIEGDAGVEAIVIWGGVSDFCFGLDVEHLVAIKEVDAWERVSREAFRILEVIANSVKPYVAAIHGEAQGAGLAIALACHYRLGSHDQLTRLGFPEIRYGLIPPFGAIQRLSDLIGVRHALDLMLTGNQLNIRKAKEVGLVDRLVHKDGLLQSAIRQAKALVGKKIVRPSYKSTTDKLLDSNPLSRSVLINQAREQLLNQTQNNYPAPLKLVDSMEMGIQYDEKAGFEAAIKNMDELVVHPVSKQLMHLEVLKQTQFNQENARDTRHVKRIGILGAGKMGTDIASDCITHDIPVLLKDVQADILQFAKQSIWQRLVAYGEEHLLLDVQVEQMMQLLITQKDNYQHFEKLDLVLEAVYEDASLKRKLLKACETICRKQCILASNTSAIPIREIASELEHPERVIGMHYLPPQKEGALIEIIVQDETALWVEHTAVAFAHRQGRMSIVVQDQPGFYTTRILAAYLNEGFLLLEEGGRIEQIDQCALELGFSAGPFTLIDQMGVDVCQAIMGGQLMALFTNNVGGGVNWRKPLQEMITQSLKGKKSQKGFYQYKTKKGHLLTNGVVEQVYTYFKATERRELSVKMMRQRLMGVVVNEAMKCLEQGVIRSEQDGDIGAVLGIGFPNFTGGPFSYVKQLGVEVMRERLQMLTDQYGDRFSK